MLFNWCLILISFSAGHEYIELKQPELANEAYRQAKELNPADWRAWYGLGQTHELLQMHSFALHYYRHAMELRPNDSRMVVALGVCYEILDEVDKAKRCFQRAIALGDNEQTALVRLAKLHESLNEPEEAATLYLQLVEKAERIGLFQPSDKFCAHQFLATHFLSRKLFEKSELHAKKCCENPQTSEVGKSILKDIYTSSSSSLGITLLSTTEDSPVPMQESHEEMAST